ncbi:NADH dehydrogenase [Ephemerocybe angulata]|uniref:NADH dehydrogenase n=1 Tax=Ephemerocybe angulata TaxID=980116 RepID=A0A8H6I4T1_9AGAR|nr:NADH dehydrogenase [Tulosesus angulatus]
MAVKPNALRLQRIARTSKASFRQPLPFHDLVTLPTQKPVISQGPPGYSAVSGHTVTVFGSTGFLARYLVSKLGKIGTQVVVPYRDEDQARHLKLMGDLGQIVRMEWDIRDEKSIAECLRHSDTVYNLVGRDYPTKCVPFLFSRTHGTSATEDVHIRGPERIARIAREEGVATFIQMSHLNADAEGEARVKEIFPNATFVRPSTMFGYEDKLLNNMAIWPIWWKLNNAETQIRPVHVMDVAQALTNLLTMPKYSGVLNLPGPSTLTYEYLLDMISTVTLRPPSKAPALPKKLAQLISEAGKGVWWPVLSSDEVTRRFINDSQVAGDWEAVGIEPSEIEDHAITYLRRYRSAFDYVRPVTFPPRPIIACKRFPVHVSKPLIDVIP